MKPIRRYGRKADIALSLWVKFARSFATLNRLAVDNLRASGLTQPQFGVLECLGHLGPQTIGLLCQKQLVTGGNMTVVIDNLEKEGLVERIRSTQDRRKVLIQLTSRGKKLFAETFPAHAEYLTGLVGVLPEREQEELARLLKKLGIGAAQRFQKK